IGSHDRLRRAPARATGRGGEAVHADRPADGPGSRPRRRLRVTLGLAMALVATLAVPMAWVTNRVRAERRAVAAIRRAGGFVDRGFRRAPTGELLPKAPNPAPRWLLRYVPGDLFQGVNFVSLRGPRVDDAVLGQVAELGGVEEIDLSGSR